MDEKVDHCDTKGHQNKGCLILVWDFGQGTQVIMDDIM